jgi:hypothetical protein
MAVYQGWTGGVQGCAQSPVVSSTPLKKTLIFHIWVVNTTYYIDMIDFRICEKVPWEQSLIFPRIENKALPFLCLISVEHALFPILCQNMSKITCIFRMTAKFREPIACSYCYVLDASNCTCCTITTIYTISEKVFKHQQHFSYYEDKFKFKE